MRFSLQPLLGKVFYIFGVPKMLQFPGPPTRFWECQDQKRFEYLGESHKSKFPGKYSCQSFNIDYLFERFTDLPFLSSMEDNL